VLRQQRFLLDKHRELFRFAVVGGTAFVVTLVVDYTLKLTILQAKPVTALAIATITSTIVSYVLSRQWSFSTRGGRQAHHEALLFFLVNAIAIGINLVPELVSRYILHLYVPEVSRFTQEVADFVSSIILGTLLGTALRWWGYRTWVFPVADARPARVRQLQTNSETRPDGRGRAA
jgi:putative flippase GtrA